MADLMGFLQNPATLDLAASLLQSAAPSPVKVNNAQAFGRGLLAYRQGLAAEQERQQRELEKKLYEMKAKQFEAQINDQNKQREFVKNIPKYWEQPQVGLLRDAGGPTMDAAGRLPDVEGQPAQFNQEAMLRDMMAVPGMQEQALERLMPKTTIQDGYAITVGPDGIPRAQKIPGIEKESGVKNELDLFLQNPEMFKQFKKISREEKQWTPQDAKAAIELGIMQRAMSGNASPEELALIGKGKGFTKNEDGTISYVGSDGKRDLSASQAKQLSDAEQLKFVLDPLENLITNQKGLFGPARGRIGEMNPYNIEAQSANAELKRARQIIGSFLEGGVLRKEDEMKYAKMLPQLSDTPEVAKAKLDGVKDLLDKKRKQLAADYEKAGFDTSNFTKDGWSIEEIK